MSLAPSRAATEPRSQLFGQAAELSKQAENKPIPWVPSPRITTNTSGDELPCGAGLLMRRADRVVGGEIGALSGGHSV
jgi:hypothetical protein